MQNIESSIEVEDEVSDACVERATIRPAPAATAVLPDMNPDNEMSRKYLADCVHRVFNFESSSLTDVDKFKRRLIRSVARSRFVEKIPETEMWEKLSKDTDCDCFVLMKRMRALTLKKLKRLLAAEDLWENVTKVARLTTTDWLLFDLVLVHENVDLIGKDSKSENSEEPKVLYELFELVTKYKIERNKKLKKQDLINAWLLLTLEYNSRGRQCSPMLLQRRWYQMKQVARLSFYTFWYSYRGTAGRLQEAWELRPTELHTKIAKRFPNIIVQPFSEWEDMVANEEVVLREDFENLTMVEPVSNKNVADVQIIETPVETIQIEEDSDTDDVATTYQSQEQCIKTQPETDGTKKSNDGEVNVRIVNIKTEPIENTTNDTPHIVMDQENEMCVSLDAEKIDEMAPISDCMDNVCNDNNELLPKIMNVTGGVELIESDDEDDTLSQHDLSKASSAVNRYEETTEIGTSNGRDCEDVPNNCLTSDSKKIADYDEDKKDFEVHLDDLIILDDGIAMEDDGIEDNCDDIIQVKTEPEENADKEADTPSFDYKLLLTPVVYTKKLNDMDVFKFIDYIKVRDIRIIECSYTESKPIDIYKKPKITKDLMNTKDELKVTQNIFDQLELEKSVGIKTELKESTESCNLISDHQKVKYSSWLLQKPKNRSYNPIQLCKNPDFNTKLKRLKAGFLIQEKNRLMLKECKRLTIDLHKAFENKLINGTLYLKSSKFTHNCKSTQVMATNPLVDRQTLQNLEYNNMNLLNETPAAYKSTQNVTNIVSNFYPESFESNNVDDLKDTNNKLLTVEISPIVTSKKPPVEIVNNETKESKLIRNMNMDQTLLKQDAYEINCNFEVSGMELNQNAQLHPNLFKLDASHTNFCSENVNNDKIEVEENMTYDIPGHKEPNIDACMKKTKEENNKYLESEQLKPNKDACDINSYLETSDNDNIEVQELQEQELRNPKKAKKQLSKTQIEKSLKRIFMKAPINYRCSTSLPSRTPFNWKASSKLPHNPINISDAYGDALLASSTLEKMIKVLTHQPIDSKQKKHKRKMVLENLKEQRIPWKKKHGNKIKNQNKEKSTDNMTVENIEEINKNVTEENDRDSNTNETTSILKEKTKEKNKTENKKRQYCCWALEKLLSNKEPDSPHYCPHPICICCCRDRLLEKTLQLKIAKGPKTKKPTVPNVSKNKPSSKKLPIKTHSKVNNENQATADIIQIVISDDDDADNNDDNEDNDDNDDDDENDTKDNSNNDKFNRVDPNKNMTPLSKLKEFTNTPIHNSTKEESNVESLPVPDTTSLIQTKDCSSNQKPLPTQTSDSSFTQTCKTRVFAQNSPNFKNTSTHIEIPPLRVVSSPNSQNKPTTTTYFIQPNTKNLTLPNNAIDRIRYNMLSQSNDSSKPIFLGKNKILLCSTNKEESPMPESSPKEQSISEGPQSLLPPGVQIILLPSGELALSIQSGLEFNPDEIAKLSEILISVQQQITTSIGNSLTTDVSKTVGVDIKKDGNDETILQNKNILQTKSDCADSSEMLVAPNIANGNSQNIENISHDIKSHILNEASDKHGDEKINMTDDTQGLQISNDTDSQNSKKSILSDLMEMSGISENDAVLESKTLNTPNKCPMSPTISFPQGIVLTQTKLKTNSPNIAWQNPVVGIPPDSRKELSIVSSFDELKKCHEKSCQFYKMDVKTGQILPINLQIKKKSLVADDSRQGKGKSIAGPSRCVIDLTEDQGDEDMESNEPKAVENSNIKPVKLIRTIHSTGINPSRSILLEPLKQNLGRSQDPSKLINILKSKRSLLKNQSGMGKKISESRIFVSTENGEDRNVISDELDSDSDDEPLAKKALRKRDNETTSVNPELTESPDVCGALENINDAIECYTPEFLETETLGDNDEDGDCILGV